MGYFRRIAKQTFTAPLVLQGSCGATGLGTHSSTMELFFGPDNDGLIEWDIPALDRGEEIGLWFEIQPDGKRALADYDGIMSLPRQAVDLLRNNGIVVGEGFE